jgi:hypothetical protein
MKNDTQVASPARQSRRFRCAGNEHGIESFVQPGTSAPIPKFATPYGTLSRELRNRKGTSKSMILVRL